MTTTPTLPTPRFDDAEFKNRQMSEYRILQDKIDKIGGFSFTIKGWSVTAVIAASAAGTASRSLLTIITLSVGLAVMLGFFFYFELKQVRLSRLFSERARKLERSFRRFDIEAGRTATSAIRVPYTAHEIVQSSHKPRPLEKVTPRKDSGGEGYWEKWRRGRPIRKQADFSFYFLLIVLSFLLPLLPRYKAIEAHLHEVKHKTQRIESPIQLPLCGIMWVPRC